MEKCSPRVIVLTVQVMVNSMDRCPSAVKDQVPHDKHVDISFDKVFTEDIFFPCGSLK